MLKEIVNYPSVQSCATPLVFGIYISSFIYKRVNTVCVSAQHRQHQRSPKKKKKHIIGFIYNTTKYALYSIIHMVLYILANSILDIHCTLQVGIPDQQTQTLRMTICSYKVKEYTKTLEHILRLRCTVPR